MAEYRVRKESGPDHQKIFEVEVWHSGRRLSSSEGRSKKEAEQAAAKRALQSARACSGRRLMTPLEAESPPIEVPGGSEAAPAAPSCGNGPPAASWNFSNRCW